MNQHKHLTDQFYEWERRGRGHVVSDAPVLLEPNFVPFFGHFIDQGYIDDGVKHTVLSKFRRLFVPDHTVVVPTIPKEHPLFLPDDEEQPLISVFKITIPKGCQSRGEAMEQCLIMLSLARQPMSFELIASAHDIAVLMTCRESVAGLVHTQLCAYLPDCTIQELDTDPLLELLHDMQPVYTVDFGLQQEFMRPIAVSSKASHDPYTPLFGVFERLGKYESIVLQILFSGTYNAWGESINKAVTDGRGGSFFFDAPEMPSLAKEKTAHPLVAATVRLACFADGLPDAGVLLEQSALALVHLSASHHNQLMPLGDPEYSVEQRLVDMLWRQTHRVGMLINSRELATLAHVPNASLSRKLTGTARTTKRAPAYLFNQPFVLGINEHQGTTVSVGISIEQRLKHTHVIGATGMGKSTLLQSLIYQDIVANTGCCVLDPHGDLIDNILKFIPKDRVQDVVLIDPSDSLHPVGFNILSAHTELERELLASDLVALFKRFSTSWGDQLHSVLSNAIMALLYNSYIGHLGDLRKFLIEPTFRTGILATCTDPDLVYYWHKEYPLLRTSSIGSILTRLDSFLRPKLIRNMVCQQQSLDMGMLMDTNKIVLVKLSQGLIGEENSYLLGACIVAKVQQAAMARQQQAADTRTPFFCYIDEFHHFVTPSLNTMLSGARKYGLGLVCVHQDMQQLNRTDSDIANSLMSNAGVRVCFRLSDTDARRFSDGFSGFGAEDLQNLSVGEAIARVNTADADFNLAVIPLEKQAEDYTEAIVASSREKYSVSIAIPSLEAPIPPPVPVIATAPRPVKPKQSSEPEQTAETMREHRYLQLFIKKLAEQHGYKANIEVPTKDGKGQIDVLVEKGNESIAIEISVSTNAEWEVHNIQKCVAGAYTKIVACSKNVKKLERIRMELSTQLSQTDFGRVLFLSPDELPSLFFQVQQPDNVIATQNGYRVKIKHERNIDTVQAEEILRRIIEKGRV